MQAVGIFCVSETTLCARLQGRQSRVKICTNNHKLTLIKEETL